jgi:hypothetical protein
MTLEGRHHVTGCDSPSGTLLDRTLFRCGVCGASTWVASRVHLHDAVQSARGLGLRVDGFDPATGQLPGEPVLCRACHVTAKTPPRPFGRRRREPTGGFRVASSPVRS